MNLKNTINYTINYRQDKVDKKINIHASDKNEARSWFDLESVRYSGVVEFVNVEEYSL